MHALIVQRHLQALILLTTILFAIVPLAASADNWPQAAGPNLNWTVNGKAPTKWSVARNENILWRTALPNGGQGGIAVWGDRLFLTTFEEYREGQHLHS